jgi:MFS family permease
MSRSDILRNVPLRALIVAEVISTTGAQMTWLALPWFVLTTTGSPAQMTFVMLAEVVGLGLAGVPAGAVLQRLGSRTTMLVADAVRAPLMLLVPVLHWTGHLSFGALLLLAFFLGAFGGPYFAAQRMIVPELLGEDEATVSQANALTQAANRTTILLGPLLAGVLIGVIGAANVLVVDAATYVVSFLLVLVFVPRTEPAPQEEESKGILAGLKFLVHEPLLRIWIPIFVVGDAAWTAFFATVPVLVVERFDANATIAGLIFAGFGGGAVLGNVVSFRWLLQRVPGFRLIALTLPLQVAPLWLLTLHVPAGAMVVATFLSGVGNGLCNPTLHALLTLRIPPAVRAKAMSAAMTVWAFGSPLGLLTAGPVLTAYGAQPMLVAFALTQSVTMALVVATALREHGRSAPRPEALAA